MKRKKAGRRDPEDAGRKPTVEAEEEARRAHRQAESPAPGAARLIDDRAVEGANEWKEEVGGDRSERSPPGGTQR